jgi:tetratricopeptide (TPR) repeat protein
MATNRDLLLVDSNLLRQAEQLSRRRLENDPENRSALRLLGEVHRKQGKLREAADVYCKLSQLEPQDADARYLHAILSDNDWSTGRAGVRPAAFVLRQNWLPAPFHDTLLPLFGSLREKFIPVVDNDGTYDPDARQTLELPDDWDGRNRFGRLVLDALPAALRRLQLAPFKIGRFVLQVRAYSHGHFFAIHRDAPPNSPAANRMSNFVYYFHRVPRPYTGGELLLFDSDIDADTFDNTKFTCISPEDNTLVIFPPNYYHCVVPVRCPSRDFGDSRFVINGHIYREAA